MVGLWTAVRIIDEVRHYESICKRKPSDILGLAMLAWFAILADPPQRPSETYAMDGS